jgi:hypothetical protein
MTFLWNRRPSLGQRITGSFLLVFAAAGLGMGAEFLRRRFAIGSVDVEGVQNGRRARTRGRVRRRAGRRKSRVSSVART